MADTLMIDSDHPEVLNFYMSRANHEDDAGLDLYVTEDILVPRYGQATLDFKIRCQRLSDNQPARGGYYLYPRSSLAKTKFRMANSVGIIDAGYRGSIMAKIDNISPMDITIKRGERLFQICMPSLEPFTVRLGPISTETARGTGGFGSTTATSSH
jgi:dUTP pyrophosphatase